jgi:hypothetical protein
MRAVVRRGLLGYPLVMAQAVHARLTKTVALAVFSSDALSSVVISAFRWPADTAIFSRVSEFLSDRPGG